MDIIDNQFLAFVRCWTYNHAPYIKDAMDGFSIQKTHFPYLCIIVDDASTDGEPSVIRKYLSQNFDLSDNAVTRNEETDDYVLTFARHKANTNCFFAVFLLKYNHHGKKSKWSYYAEWIKNVKYHAICEGDDYWTDPCKLQKQVSFLEGHPDYGLCYTDFDLLEQSSKEFTRAVFENGVYKRPTSFEEHLTECAFIAPMSWVYRKSVFYELEYRTFTDATFAMALAFFKQSKVYYLPEVTSVYRGHSGSASRPTSAIGVFKQYCGVFRTQLFFTEKYQVEESLVKLIKSGAYIKLLPSAIESNQKEFIEEATSYFTGNDLNYNEFLKLCNAYLQAREDARRARNSLAYKIGRSILRPFSFVKGLFR